MTSCGCREVSRSPRSTNSLRTDGTCRLQENLCNGLSGLFSAQCTPRQSRCNGVDVPWQRIGEIASGEPRMPEPHRVWPEFLNVAPSLHRLVIGSQMWMLHGGSSTRERTLGPRGVGMIVLKEGVLNTLQKNAESSRLPREACSGSRKHHEIGMDLSPRPFLMRKIPSLHRQCHIDPNDNRAIGDGVCRNEPNGARSGGHGVDDPRV